MAKKLDFAINCADEASYLALPKTQRDALDAYLQGHSYEQIALALSIPLGTVRSRLNRARGAIAAARQTAASEVAS